MSDKAKAFLDSVKNLSREERAEIAEGILATLEDEFDAMDEEAFDSALGQEAERRLQGYRNGTIESEPGEKVIAEILAKYKVGLA